jgi:ATP-binding cassette, subfamily B, bacterial
MERIDPLPAALGPSLTAAGIAPDTVRVTVRSDLDAFGAFGESWFVLAESDIVVLEADGTVRTRMACADIRSVHATAVVGGGVFGVSISGDSQDLVRYSNVVAGKFAYVARWMGEEIEHREGKRDEAPVWDFEEDEKFCKQCGLALRDEYAPCPACTKKHRVMLRIFTYLRPYKGRTALVLAMLLATTFISLVPTYFNKIIIDDVLKINLDPAKDVGWIHSFFRDIGSASAALGITVGILLLTHVLTNVLGIFHGRLGAWLTFRIVADIRAELYAKLHSLSLRFFDKRKTGTVISHITEDSSRLQHFLLESLSFIVRDGLMLIAIGIGLFFINWRLACFVLIPVPAIVFGAKWFWTRVRSLWHRAYRRSSKLYDVVGDSVSGIRVVRAFGRQEGEVDRFGEANIDARDYMTSAEMVWATYYPLLGFTVTLGSLIVWYSGVLQIIAGDMSLGDLMLFHGYLGMFYGPLRHISPIINWASRSMTAAERIFEVIDSEAEQTDDGTLVSIPSLNGEVQFTNMTFGYEPHKPVLRDINLHVKPGEMIGLVGHSGAGKSTLINLLCRFYVPDGGLLEIDGSDITKIRLEDLRRQIGVVLQEPYLFSGTIAENIAYAHPDAPMEQIIAAAKAANAHEFVVKFADGYDTEVGERGGRLSGGERQRISISRAILHNPRILILDEATSSVDVQTEQKIQQAIDRLVQNRTTFAIAHRLSTLRNADRLLVLDKGKAVECGSHDELMEKKGVYYKLVETQREVSEIRSKQTALEG